MREYEQDLEEFIEDLEDKGCTKSTLKSYRLSVEILIHFLDGSRTKLSRTKLEWEKITEKDLRMWIRYLRTERQNKAKTRQLRITAVKAFFKFLRKEEKIVVDPAIDLIIPKSEKTLPKFRTKEEIDKLLDLPKPIREQAILEMFCGTGMRLAELVNLNVEDVRFIKQGSIVEKARISILSGKGNKDRTVPLARRPAEILLDYITRRYTREEREMKLIESYNRARKEVIDDTQANGYFISDDAKNALFVSNRIRRISRRQVQSIVAIHSKHAGIKECSPHILRHSFATILIRSGVSIKVVQMILGHSSSATTDLYTHVTLDHIEDEFHSKAPRQ